MPELFSQIKRCVNCNADTKMILHRRQMTSGGFHYCWQCSSCRRMHVANGRTWISASIVSQFLTPEQIDALPIISADEPVNCVKCGSLGAELHHWAPRAIFGNEADQWPTDYLCLPCHRLWHDTINKQRAFRDSIVTSKQQ
jgi:hypothetical protein